MNRNVKVLLLVSALFGLAMGIYEFVLPFYLRDKGISFMNMGIIFSVASIAMFFIRINAGRLSDIHGRKIVYLLTLAGLAIANFFTSFASRIFSLVLLKSTREAAGAVQESIHSVALFENAKNKFMNFISKTQGALFIFYGLGSLLAGFLIVRIGSKNTFIFNALLSLSAFFLMLFFFKEEGFKNQKKENAYPSKLYSFDLSKPLAVITLSSFIFNIGMSASHSFMMPLFFIDKFGASKEITAVIMAIHRILLGVPMLATGILIKESMDLKRTYIWFLVVEGILMSASALIPQFLPATIVWLGHDTIGAASWIPVQLTLIQRYSNSGKRASDVTKVAAFSTLGLIIGPLLSGWLYPVSVNLPFFVSGIIMMAAALMLIPLQTKVPSSEFKVQS